MLNINSTIFKTITSSVDESRKTLALFNKDWNTYKTNWQNANGVGGKIGSIFASSNSGTSASVISNDQVQILRNWNNAVKHGCTDQATFNRIIANADENTKMYFAGLNKGKGSIEGLKNAQKVATQSTIGLTIAQTALNMAITMGITALVSIIAKGYDELANSVENCKERVDDLMSSYKSALDTANNNASRVEELADKYEDLSKGVNNLGENVSLTNEEYQEYNSLVNEIADMFPTLVQGYTDEGNAILNLKGNVEQLRDAYKEAQQEAYNLLIVSGEDADGNDIIKQWEDTHDTGFWSSIFDLGTDDVGGEISVADALEQLRAIQQMSADKYREIERIISSGSQKEIAGLTDIEKEIGYGSYLYKALGLDSNSTDEEFREAQRQAKSLIQTYNAEIEAALSDVETLANAYLMTNEDYDKLDEQSKSAASMIVNSLNADIANEFSSKEDVATYVDKIVQTILADDKSKLALTDLFTMDTSDMSINEIETQVDSYINIIATALKEDPIELKARLGFDNSDTEPLVNKVQGLLSDEFDSKVGELTFDELDIASKLEIPEGTLLTWDELKQKIEEVKNASPDESDSLIPISKTISDLEDLNKELDNLGTAMANIDAEGKFDLGDLDSIADYFLGLEDVPYDIEAVNNALKSLSDGNASLEEQTDSINTLADQYLKTSGILDTLTQSNRNLIQVQLERMGIVNAEEIVTAALNEQTELQALNNQFLAATGYELVNASYAEIQAFLDECNASDAARQEISKLALAKLDLSSFHYDSSVDVQNIVNLANAAGAGAEQIATFQAAMNALNSSSRTKQDWGYQVLSQIKNGTYDWGYEKLDANKFKATYTQVPKAIYNGGANVQKALDDANKAASSSAKETEDTYEELFDFFERRIEVLNDALDLLKSNLENVVGADAKNTLIDAQIGINKESINNYTDALAMYTQKANEALAKIPVEFQSKIVDGSVSMTDFIGSGNEDLVEAINEYKDWAGKISDCKKELADLKQALEDLELDKFNNIVDDFTNQFDIRDNSKDLINKQIDLFEEAGQMTGKGFYEGLIKESEGQLSILQQEKEKLVTQLNSALNSGNVEVGSEAWLSMIDSLNEVDVSILECKKDIEEFNNSIQELHWEVVERIQKNFDGLSDEIKNIIGLIDEVDVSDAEGIWSKEGLTQLGLYAQEYEKAIYATNMYGEEIEQLNQAYIRGEYSATEYQDKLIELKNAQWDEINASESAKDAIMDLNKARIDIMVKAIEEEIDAMKELINSKKEALDSEKDLYEYKKSISEKSKSVTDLEKQIAAMQNDSTAATIAKRKKLEEQLVEAKQDLADYEYSHSIDVQKDVLDQQYEDFETEKNAEIEKLEATLDDMEAVISASFELVKEKALVIGTEINNIAQAHGVSISNEITSAWSKGADAIAYYGDTLNVGTSSFVSNLTTMKDSVYNLQGQADITSISLANMYNTNSQALLNNLTDAYYSLANTNTVTQALGNSLINTLARGYDTSSLVNSIKNVGDSASNAAKQVSSLMNALAGQPTSNGLSNGSSGSSGKYAVVLNGVRQTDYFSSKTDAEDWIKKTGAPKNYYYVAKFAKGGIITKEDSGFLDPLAKSVGEDHMIAAKDGESILTQVQTTELMKLVPNMESFNKIIPNIIPDINTMVSPNAVKPNSPTVQIHYDNLVQVQGDVNNSNIRQMEQIVDNAITKQFNIFNTQLRKAGVR